jgi:uncharacterized protein YbcI
MTEYNFTGKTPGKMKKEIEDFFKSWLRKYFQKGLRTVRVTIADRVIVICCDDFLTVVEQSITDDDYSRQLVIQTRKKVAEKNYPVLKQNLELITGIEIEHIYLDFSIDTNTLCMTIVMKEELGVKA